eukprot:4045344-Lingulodinium_polyedra.AAC.1
MQRMGALPAQRLQGVPHRPMLSHEGEALTQGNEEHVHTAGRVWVDHLPKARYAGSQNRVGAMLKQG